jgi:resuscitation-promoting factor RpfA
LYYVPKHAAAREQHQMRNRVAGVAAIGSATLVTGVGMSGPAEAAGNVWDRVAACESSGNWHINTGNGFTGGIQFLGSTWRGFGGLRYAPRADLASKAQQIRIAQNVLKVQGPGAWPVCGKRAGLTRANGGAAQAARPASRSKARAAVRPATVRVAAVQRELAVDGIIGPLTTRATQRWVGVTQDGIFGPRTTKALQRKVGARVDGVIGAATVQALQVKIGARRDGAQHLSMHTAKALQKFLNAR